MTEFTPEWIAGAREVVGNDAASPSGQIAFIALDHIERLQARVTQLEEQQRWIPVSERLPEDTMIYDVAVAGYQYSWTGSCVFGKWIGESGKAILGVTHWKYRPQLPKESEEE